MPGTYGVQYISASFLSVVVILCGSKNSHKKLQKLIETLFSLIFLPVSLAPVVK